MWSYAYQKSEFYGQLEEDLIAEDHYMEFIVDQLTSVTETGFRISNVWTVPDLANSTHIFF